jgi:hypothetical protein
MMPPLAIVAGFVARFLTSRAVKGLLGNSAAPSLTSGAIPSSFINTPMIFLTSEPLLIHPKQETRLVQVTPTFI